MSESFTENTAAQRFELDVDGQMAWCDYRRQGEVLILPHVEADMSLRGTGAAARLMQQVLQSVRDQGLKVKPLCGYAVAYLRRHPENDDLLA